MFKKIALMLAFCLMGTVMLTACQSDNNASSADTSSAASSENSSATEASGTASESETSSPATDIKYATVVSTGKSYTSSVEAGDAYSDTYGSELTDGLFAPNDTGDYTNPKYSGYSSSPLIVVDLGEIRNDVYAFKASYLAINAAGIAPPSSIRVHYSIDGEEWKSCGVCAKPTYVENTAQIAELTLDHTVEARYIRFNITKASAWVFLDELQVIANVEASETDSAFIEQINAAYAAETLTYEQRLSLLSTVSGEAPDKTLKKTLVSLGASYQASVSADSTYADSDGKLTDGVFGSFYESGTWVGYPATDGASVTVTLSKERSDIAELALACYGNLAVGITLPACVTFEISSDNTNFTEIGRVYAPTNAGETFAYTLTLDRCVRAKYVRFTMQATDAQLFLVDEAAVYAYENASGDTLYPVPTFPSASKDDLWSSSEADYNKTVNLLSGLPVQVLCGTEPLQSAWGNNTPIDSKILTDGIYSTDLNIHNGSFFKSNGDSHRDLFFDLTKVSAVSSFTASFDNRSEWAVYAPSVVKIYLSYDAVTWFAIGRINMPTEDGTVVKGTLTLDTAVQARFVCFSYDYTVWAGCDELEVFGTKNASAASDPSSLGLTSKKFLTNEYLTPSADMLAGAEDILLAYHAKTFDWTADDFKPYVAYLNTDGKAVDTMFDGYLFLLSGSFPSGAAGHQASIMTDWQWELNSLFTEGKNIDALNTAVGAAASELGLKNHKNVFYVSIYLPGADATAFGDVDGDGKTENFSKIEDRLKAIRWYVNTFYEKYAETNWENLTFGGFYWYDEAITPSDENITVLNGTADIVHEHDTQFFWIPYFTAKGYSNWADFGFDAACMQPNYVFNETAPLSNVKNCADLTKRYGMCLEIEISGKSLNSDLFLQRYLEYLKGGNYYGYDKALHMYYQDTLCFSNACYSTNVKARLVYDYTYQFIKGTLNLSPDAVDALSASTAADTYLESTLADSESALPRNFTLVTSPAHGTVTINADGTYRYYPDKGYTGSDSFTYAYNYQLDNSAPCTVNITVG